MAARTYYYTEDLTRATTITTDFSVFKASFSFTPNGSKNHLVLWRCLLDVAAGGGAFMAQARLRNTTDSVTYGTSKIALAQGASTAQSAGGMAIYTSTASPGSKTFRVEYAVSNASTTAGIKEVSILVLELGTNDKFFESTGASSTSSASYVNKTSLSFTPPSSGDYLLMAHAVKTQSDGGTDCRVRFSNGTTDYVIPSLFYTVTGDCIPYVQMVFATALSAAQSWTIDHFRLDGVGTTTLQEARIVALRLADFEHAYCAEDRTPHTTILATFANSASVAATALAVDHAVLACGIVDMSSTGQVTYASNKVNAGSGGGSDVGSAFSAVNGSVGFNKVWWEFRKRTETAVSTTWRTQYNRVSGTETPTHDENVIAVLQLGGTSTMTVAATGFAPLSSTGVIPIISPSGM